MRRSALPVVCAATVFVLAVVAIRDHSTLIRLGYRLSESEGARDRLLVDAARERDRVSRLRSPVLLAERAKEFGLATEYPAEFAVVRFGSREGADHIARVQDR